MTDLKLIKSLELLGISTISSPVQTKTRALPLDPTGDFRHPDNDKRKGRGMEKRGRKRREGKGGEGTAPPFRKFLDPPLYIIVHCYLPWLLTSKKI